MRELLVLALWMKSEINKHYYLNSKINFLLFHSAKWIIIHLKVLKSWLFSVWSFLSFADLPGITLSVKTINGDLFTGELFYYNQESRVLILSKPFKLSWVLSEIEEKIHESNKYNYRYLNTACLTEFKILELRDINVISQFWAFSIIV